MASVRKIKKGVLGPRRQHLQTLTWLAKDQTPIRKVLQPIQAVARRTTSSEIKRAQAMHLITEQAVMAQAQVPMDKAVDTHKARATVRRVATTVLRKARTVRGLWP